MRSCSTFSTESSEIEPCLLMLIMDDITVRESGTIRGSCARLDRTAITCQQHGNEVAHRSRRLTDWLPVHVYPGMPPETPAALGYAHHQLRASVTQRQEANQQQAPLQTAASALRSSTPIQPERQLD